MRNISGEILMGSVSGCQCRLRSIRAAWRGKTSGKRLATSARTMALALIVSAPIGCTPQYPPSKKYKSTEGEGLGSVKWAFNPIHLGACFSCSEAAMLRLDQRPEALITAPVAKLPAEVVRWKGPLPEML